MSVVLAAALLIAPAGWAVVLAVRSNANDVRDWVPAHYAETRDYRWFREYFGNEDFVVVSWPGCTLDDPRLARLAEQLRERNEQRAQRGEFTPFRRVATGQELVARMTDEPLYLEREEAIARLQGTILGPDGETTCAVVTLNNLSHGQLKPALAEITAAAADVGIPADSTYLGGPPVVNAAIDQSSTQSLVRLAGVAALIGLVVAWLCFRTVRLTVIVFVIATYSAVLSLAIVPLFGVPLNAILVTMVPLVYVAAMSGAIHLANYYLDCLRAGESHPVREAIHHASLPLGLATATTAVGLLSLWYSDLAPIRMFGLFSALGIAVALALQLGLLPALLTLWPVKLSNVVQEHPELDELSPSWRRLVGFVVQRHAIVAGGCLLVLAVSLFGLLRVQTSIQVMRLLSADTPIIAHYDWLEKHLGALVPTEVVVRFPVSEERGIMLRRLQVVRKIEQSIQAAPGVGGSLSAATFAPETPTGGAFWNYVERTTINRRLMQARPQLTEAGYLASTADEELWRISVRVTAGEDLDYGLFQQELQARIEPILVEANAASDAHASATFTGAVPIIYKARRSLLSGLSWGFGTDVLLVVIAVIVMLRHWSNGLLLLFTSIFPMAICFGTMGWLGVVVDIGSVMTPCVALGVTIDDVIHFVLWFRRGVAQGRSVQGAVELAYAGCGRAMVQSWGVIGLGLAAFAFSSFIPTFRFGALMLGLLTVGLAGNLLFLPALLAGPLGRIIAARVPWSPLRADQLAALGRHAEAKISEPQPDQQPA